jgi:hypothetical protein
LPLAQSVFSSDEILGATRHEHSSGESKQEAAMASPEQGSTPSQSKKTAKICVRWCEQESGRAVAAPAFSIHDSSYPEKPLECSPPEKPDEGRYTYSVQLQHSTLLEIRLAEGSGGEGPASLYMWCDPDRESPCCASFPVRANYKAAKTGRLRIHTSVCMKERERHVPGASLPGALIKAEPIGQADETPDKSSALSGISATTTECGFADLYLASGRLYKISIQTAQSYAEVHPHLPLFAQICDDEDIEMTFCFRPCEKMMTLIFTDSCGQPLRDTFFFVGCEEKRTDRDGRHAISAPDAGIVHISSPHWNFVPSQIPVGSAMAQASVVVASKRTAPSLSTPAAEEGFIIEFAELDPEKKAFVRMLTRDGNEVDTRDTDAKGCVRFPGKKGEEYDFEAIVDGMLVEKFTLTA